MPRLSPPPSRIYLLRHAKSAWALPGQRDFDRPLDDTGFAEAEFIADTASDRGYRPDLVISSTATRCRQTAEAMRRIFGPELELQYVDALYNGTIDTYIEIMDAQTAYRSVMLVGHNPTMEETFEALVGREVARQRLPEGYPTAGLAVIDDAGSDPHWALHDMLAPR